MRLSILSITIFLLMVRNDFAQLDTMYVDVGTSIMAYPISNIAQLTFSGIGTSIDAKELDKMNQILNSFALHQNYPNPFNPSTTISFHLPRAGDVSVKIYNMEGKLINEVVNALYEAGDHSFMWDGKNDSGIPISSGVYLYQVQFDNSILTKKMIYIK